MRTTERVIEKGIDLQKAISDASAEYGGGGGGHKIAAGAFIPKSAEQEFVNRVNRILGEQFAARGSRRSLITSSGALQAPGSFPKAASFCFSTTGRIRQILYGGVRLATIRASDGRLTLGMEGARRLHAILPAPGYRVGYPGRCRGICGAGKERVCKARGRS